MPFWTDTKNAYQRVRICAQARAIENECYVAITSSVGNLPRVENMDIQYSQSAVFSPWQHPLPGAFFDVGNAALPLTFASKFLLPRYPIS